MEAEGILWVVRKKTGMSKTLEAGMMEKKWRRIDLGLCPFPFHSCRRERITDCTDRFVTCPNGNLPPRNKILSQEGIPASISRRIPRSSTQKL